MLEALSRRGLIAAVALSLAAGCSGASAPNVANQSLVPSARQVPQGFRVVPGPVVAGPRIVPIVPRAVNAPHGWPNALLREVLFVADSSSGVLLYNPRIVNASPKGSITTGVNIPSGVAIDNKGKLYVTNDGNNTVTVYPHGSKSPSLTISTGVNGPYGIAVDSKGNVFVSMLGNNTVVGYKAGQTSPFETINFSSLGQPVGVGVDGLDNIWVACDSSSAVFEIPAGSSTPKNANLSGLGGPVSVSFGKSDVMYVSNFTSANVQVYAYGTTTPSTTITNGIEKFGPALGAFVHGGAYFQSNQSDDVVGYKLGLTSPFSKLKGASTPLGVAGWPEIVK